MKTLWLAVAVLAVCGCKNNGGGVNKTPVARLMLNRLGKNAKVYWVTNDKFPVGKATTLPAEDCCKATGYKCAITQDWAKDPLWTAFDFQIDESSYFRYSLESDGTKVHATAVGDLDCDGVSIIYTLDVVGGADGPKMTLTEPNAQD